MSFETTISFCGIENTSGTGSDICDVPSLDDITGIAITTKDVKFNKATDNLATKYRELIRKKKIFPMTSLYNFEQSTPDNEVSTSSVGIKFEIREGKVELSFIYNKSHCYHKSIFSKKAFKKWNLIVFFKNVTVGADTADGLSWKGFDMGMFSVGTFKVQQGTDPQMTKVTVQFTEIGTKEWNTRMGAISNDSIGEDFNEIDGVIETAVSYKTAPVAGTETIVNVKSTCNGQPKSGLIELTNWVLGGTQTTPAAITGVTENANIPGEYTLTHGALVATDTIQPRLGNATELATEDVLGIMYSGSAAIATIA